MARPVSMLAVGLLALVIATPPLQAQIVITADEFKAQTGTTFQELLASDNAGPFPSDLSTLESITLLDGNNSIFDFSGITELLTPFSNNRYINLPTDSLNLPGYDAHFEGIATDAWQVEFLQEGVPDAFVFRRITSDSLAWVGNGIWQDSDGDGVADPVVSIFTPGKLQAPLPMSLGDAWESDFTHIGIVNTPIGTITVSGTVETHDIVVDGYGTLITHHGSYACLRVRINQTLQYPDGSMEELGGWSYVTANLVQLGVFYDQLIPDDPAEITFDRQQPHSISYFSPQAGDMPTAIEETAGDVPRSFTVDQNYPNPFNLHTTIPFELFGTEHTQLSIFNALGQRIDTPLNTVLPAGRHNIRWDAGQLPAGVYFFRLSRNGVVQQRAMTLLK